MARLASSLRQLQSLLDLVYPRSCEICGGPCGAADGYLCWNCRSDIRYHEPTNFCSRCGRPFPGTAPANQFVCTACREHPPRFLAARSAAHFTGVVHDAVIHFKYHRALWLVPVFADLLEACVRTHYARVRFDALCPVPLHPLRFRERGFNQSELLANALSRRLGVPCLAHALVRSRYTETQTRLKADQRRQNVAALFNSNPAHRDILRDRSILLVDDVMTTGSTVNDATRALLEAGAAEVRVATIARD